MYFTDRGIGRGRTGTAVACLAILDGVPSSLAVAFVREHYHPGAVETLVRDFRLGAGVLGPLGAAVFGPGSMLSPGACGFLASSWPDGDQRARPRGPVRHGPAAGLRGRGAHRRRHVSGHAGPPVDSRARPTPGRSPGSSARPSGGTDARRAHAPAVGHHEGRCPQPVGQARRRPGPQGRRADGDRDRQGRHGYGGLRRGRAHPHPGPGGASVPIGTPIAVIGEAAAAATAPSPVPAADQAERAVVPAPALAPPTAASPAGRLPGSPLARKLARAQGVDLSTVSGSGPGGRIVRADIENGARERGAVQPVPQPAAPTGPARPLACQPFGRVSRGRDPVAYSLCDATGPGGGR